MEYKVIFHIDESAKWRLLLGNVENLLNASAHMTVEVLANGEAVLQYAADGKAGPEYGADGLSAQKMALLHGKGVVFAACRNAMKANGLTEDNLMVFVTTVPAGVMELVEKQAQGYGYIKP